MKSSDQRSVNVGDGSPCQFRMREKKLNVGVLLRQKKKKSQYSKACLFDAGYLRVKQISAVGCHRENRSVKLIL